MIVPHRKPAATPPAGGRRRQVSRCPACGPRRAC